MEYKPNTAGNLIMGADDDEDTGGASAALADFLLQLDNYTPSVPDAVVAHYLDSAGFHTQDPRLIRLIALAAQKFLSEIANDALQHCKVRTSGQPTAKGHKPKERRFLMTMDDLAPALLDCGIVARKPPYFV
ncbi:Transcription initiation factor TFIID subunit 10 [Eumeta japonica]|uniref:Transcription initiation factor TFIID subunit 10 n=1 Tax=Eumeta variegata TaxID=151549 RepID=A0A4C1W5I9_EUMVA|nr:Transcription initiation factor TFIID subunit 10 [Eumeta japonica]